MAYNIRWQAFSKPTKCVGAPLHRAFSYRVLKPRTYQPYKCHTPCLRGGGGRHTLYITQSRKKWRRFLAASRHRRGGAWRSVFFTAICDIDTSWYRWPHGRRTSVAPTANSSWHTIQSWKNKNEQNNTEWFDLPFHIEPSEALLGMRAYTSSEY